jgi:hypothetical protein
LGVRVLPSHKKLTIPCEIGGKHAGAITAAAFALHGKALYTPLTATGQPLSCGHGFLPLMQGTHLIFRLKRGFVRLTGRSIGGSALKMSEAQDGRDRQF